MPRLGVPSTTDSAPRLLGRLWRTGPLTRSTNPRHYSRPGGPLPRILQPLIESPEKGRKEGAWGHRARQMRPFRGGGRAHSLRQGRNEPENSCWPIGERSAPREAIDPSKFYDDAQNQGQFLQHRLHSDKAWHVKEAYVGLRSTALI